MSRNIKEVRAVAKALAIAAAVALACVMVFQWEMSVQQLAGMRSDLAQARQSSDRFQAALKFFELQTSLGVADYGDSPSGIMASDPDILALTKRLKTPDAAFDWVVSNISYSRAVALDNISARPVYLNRVGNCQGKANLLASMMLDMGVPSESMRIVYGHVRKDGMPSAHAWLEVLKEGRWIVYDSTPFLQSGPGKYDRDQYYAQNSVVPVVVYTDKHVGFDLE
jgi:transglutaminase-like putative cysteine protease